MHHLHHCELPALTRAFKIAMAFTVNCFGDTAEPDSGKLACSKLGRSGQICASTVSEPHFTCDTTGIFLDSNGIIIDDFASGTKSL